jgi:pimeloyl-ACP methyl ester carboxylesterase
VAETQIFDPASRAIPYIDEGEGPTSLILIPERGLDGDALGVIAHYLAEEAGFRVVRIGSRPDSDGSEGVAELSERADDTAAVIDHLDLAGSWIGGHGTGGTVARAVAAEHSHRVGGLLLLAVEDEQIPLPSSMPVLIIQGTDDEITPSANGERLQSTASDRASIAAIQRGDHLFPMTHPVETAVLIEEYLDWD